LPLGRIDEALTQLRIAEELDPTSPATHFALIQPLTALGRVEEADSHCDRAAEDDQQRSVCWNHVLERQGRADEAIRMLEDHLNGHRPLEWASAGAGRGAIPRSRLCSRRPP
jgi:tetratricopeptide (TPR) repeat protein